MDALGQLAERSDGGFPHLTRARDVTEARLVEMRDRLRGIDCDVDACVALFGSWGRGELTEHSDDDWAILIDGASRAGSRPQPADMEDALGIDGREPGGQGVFGATVSCDNLVERIGLDGDDNKNLTRRMLLLLESVAVVNQATHLACRERVLNGYLDDSVKGYRPPRRYWRTICVDFVGKEREGEGQKWALRNLKLGLSRKALFAGGLLPVLLCHRFAAADIYRFLDEAFARPSLDRIAWAFLRLDAADAGVRAVGAYDRFLGLLNNSDARRELELLSRDQARESEFFVYGKRLVADFQQGLLALLFETQIEPLVREYGIF